MKRTSFVFYESFYDAIKQLPDDERLKSYEAVMEYGLTGEVLADLSPVSSAIFKLIKPLLDANNVKYENGKKGGRKPLIKQTEKEPKQNQEITEDKPKDNQTITEADPYVDVDVDVDVNVDDRCIIDKPIIFEVKPHDVNYNKIIDHWNNETKGLFGNLRKPLSENRRKLIKARIKEYGEDLFHETIDNISNNKYLRGVAWFNFDWMIRPTNYEKIISGNYDERDNTRTIGTGYKGYSKGDNGTQNMLGIK